MADTNAVVPVKRKRPQISYAEPDDEVFERTNDEARSVLDLSSAERSYNDAEHGVQKKTSKRKMRPKKQIGPVGLKTKPNKSFPFLNLPPELRDYIYELSLTEPGGLTLVSKLKSFRRTVGRGLVYSSSDLSCNGTRRVHDFVYPKERWNNLIPNLLAVSKQINSEAAGYLYKQRIILEDTMALHTFLAAIGHSNRLMLSNVVVKDWGCGRGTHKAMNVAALSFLSSCTNLRKLHFDCRIGHFRTPKHLARQIFRDGHYFLEAFGAAHERKDAGIDVLQLHDCNFAGRYPLEEPEKSKIQFQEELRRLLMV